MGDPRFASERQDDHPGPPAGTHAANVGSEQSHADAHAQRLLAVIALVIVAGLVALVVTLVQDEEAATVPFDAAVATVEGAVLPGWAGPGGDAAVGRPAPVVEGLDREGHALVAPAAGRPTVLLFVAHWCSHCQAELPQVQDWVDDGELPDGVDLVAVATATRPDRPNYPPSAWLEREDWTVPTIGDRNGTAARAHGVSMYPFWVAVDADGVVVDRRAGQLSMVQLTQLARAAGR